jgi:O-antigen/teichoic acid export membrane protein
MSETIRQGKTEDLIPIWHDAVRKLSFFLFPLVAWLLLISHELIVTLYTPRFEASVPIFMVWTTAMLLAVFPSDSVLRVYARTRFLLVLRMVALSTTIAVIGISISHFQMMGAVMVSLTVGLIDKSLGLSRIKRLLNVSFTRLIPWRSLAACLGVAFLSTLPSLFLKTIHRVSNMEFMIVSTLTFGAAYLALLYGLDLLTEEERVEIRTRFHRITGFIQRELQVMNLKAGAGDRGRHSPGPLHRSKNGVEDDLTEFP